MTTTVVFTAVDAADQPTPGNWVTITDGDGWNGTGRVIKDSGQWTDAAGLATWTVGTGGLEPGAVYTLNAPGGALTFTAPADDGAAHDLKTLLVSDPVDPATTALIPPPGSAASGAVPTVQDDGTITWAVPGSVSGGAAITDNGDGTLSA